MKAKELRSVFTDKEEASRIIAERLYALPQMQEARTVAVYCSTPEEVRTDELIQKLLDEGRRVCVPLVRGKDMVFQRILSSDELTERASFGIREPVYDPERIVPGEEIDAAVFPGLAFDEHMNRIGYGGGYYDRYFARYPSVCRIGVCYGCQLFDELPQDEYDLRMQVIVTEKAEKREF